MTWRKREVDRLSLENLTIPDYERDVHDPFLLKGMDKAVARILEAIKKKEKILIFGDYDADGVPATALLATVFNWIGHTNFSIYIPDRHNEAFGLSAEAIKKFAGEEVKLLITVDCGITDTEEVALANSLGLEVIITDHHICPEELPPALAVIDPKRPDCNYPDKNLCGTGVAFKVAQAILKAGKFESVNEGREKWLLDLVALATVADMVPITGENRALTYFGLTVLQKTRRPGLLALCRALKLKPQFITEDDIGFSLGPRINSASRMSHASEAYELLMSEDEGVANAIATSLELRNGERRGAVDAILKTAEAIIGEKNEEKILVVGQAGFSLGVLGLTASRLVEKYHKPVFVWGVNGLGEVKGSCRSDGSVNVVALMRACSPLASGEDFFSDFGGHVMAGGFSLPLGREVELAAKLNAAYEDAEKQTLEKEIIYDQELNLDEVTNQKYEGIRAFGPFGPENEKPIFLFKSLVVSEVKMFGNGGLHLELKFKNTAGKSIPAIGFFFTKDLTFKIDEKVDLLASIEKSYFRNFPELRLRIVDIKKSE